MYDIICHGVKISFHAFSNATHPCKTRQVLFHQVKGCFNHATILEDSGCEEVSGIVDWASTDMSPEP